MNACIRAVVRTCVYHNLENFGIIRGYQGMIEGNFIPMQSSSVSNIIQLGGTILKSARSKEFFSPEGRKKAFRNLQHHEIDGLVAIGGDGTFRGASIFSKETGIPVIGVPGTIDNDLYGTDFTIGFDTAINTAVEAIDKIRNTADSHDRIFFVEVMGRDAGFIAMECGIGSGAEVVMVPETITTMQEVFDILKQGWNRQKTSSIIIVAEGDEEGNAGMVASKVKEKFPQIDARVLVLGHIQRGGSPSAYDRVLASRLGLGAVEGLMTGMTQKMAGVVNGKLTFTELEECVSRKKEINQELLRITEILRV